MNIGSSNRLSDRSIFRETLHPIETPFIPTNQSHVSGFSTNHHGDARTGQYLLKPPESPTSYKTQGLERQTSLIEKQIPVVKLQEHRKIS